MTSPAPSTVHHSHNPSLTHPNQQQHLFLQRQQKKAQNRPHVISVGQRQSIISSDINTDLAVMRDSTLVLHGSTVNLSAQAEQSKKNIK
jgi:hypothetical protein